MPSEKEKIFKFTNIQKQLRAPFVVYADFECILKETGIETSLIGISEEGTSKTVKYQDHVPISYAYKVVSDIPDYQPELKLSDVSENVAKDFLDDIQNVADHIMTEYILKLKAKPTKTNFLPSRSNIILMVTVIYVVKRFLLETTYLLVNVGCSITAISSTSLENRLVNFVVLRIIIAT